MVQSSERRSGWAIRSMAASQLNAVRAMRRSRLHQRLCGTHQVVPPRTWRYQIALGATGASEQGRARDPIQRRRLRAEHR